MRCSITQSAVQWEDFPGAQTKRRGVSRPGSGLLGGEAPRPSVFCACCLFLLLNFDRRDQGALCFARARRSR
jgi:hypothetical protein